MVVAVSLRLTAVVIYTIIVYLTIFFVVVVLECLATWREGASKFLIGRWINSETNAEPEEYRCFVRFINRLKKYSSPLILRDHFHHYHGYCRLLLFRCITIITIVIVVISLQSNRIVFIRDVFLLVILFFDQLLFFSDVSSAGLRRPHVDVC